MKDLTKENFGIFGMRLFLSLCGVKLKNDSFQYLNHYIAISVCDMLIITQQLILLHITDEFNIITVIVNNLIHCVNYTVTWITIFRNQYFLKTILKTIRKGIFQFPRSMNKYILAQQSSSLTLKLFFFMNISTYVIVLFIPIVNFIFQNHEKITSSDLMYPAWYPWNLTKTTYFLTYFQQVFFAYISATYMILNIWFLLYFVLIVQHQKNSLLEVMQSIKEDMVYKMNSEMHTNTEQDTTFKEETWHYIMKCIEYHRAISRSEN